MKRMFTNAIEEEIIQRLRKFAANNNRKINDVLESSITQYIDGVEKKNESNSNSK